MKNTLIVICCFSYTMCLSQVKSAEEMQKEFEQFQLQQEHTFDNFSEAQNKEFSDFLKKNWEEFELLPGIPAPQKPKPVEQPADIPAPIEQPNKDILPVISIEQAEKPIEKPTPVPVETYAGLNMSKGIVFYGNSHNIKYNNSLLANASTVDESGVAAYWDMMSKSDYTPFLKQVVQLSEQMSLNDWGKYQLIKQIAEKLLGNANDQKLFQFFMLNQLGYNAKVARNSGSIVTLIPFKNIVYEIPFLYIEKTKYYIIDEKSSGSYYTFKQNFSQSGEAIDLNIKHKLKLGTAKLARELAESKLSKKITVDYNTALIDFFSSMPQTELQVKFQAQISEETLNSLTTELSPLLEGRNELDAVNLLLDFVQKSFSYKTDQDQFGYEKCFFSEELFKYPYSDCEDRSVLFLHLVKIFLQLEVIGLSYPDHVATAVLFSGKVNGDAVTYNNKKYIICDPTYIGASAGMAMPKYKHVSPTVIDVE